MLIGRKEQLLKLTHERGFVADVFDQRCYGLEQIMRKGWVSRILAQLEQHPTQLLQTNRRHRFDVCAAKRDDAHDALHHIFIFRAIGNGERVEHVGVELLTQRRDVARDVSRHARTVANGEQTFKAICRVGVHDVFICREQLHNRR